MPSHICTAGLPRHCVPLSHRSPCASHIDPGVFVGKAVLLHLSLKRENETEWQNEGRNCEVHTQSSGRPHGTFPKCGSGQREEGSLALGAVGPQGGKPGVIYMAFEFEKKLL